MKKVVEFGGRFWHLLNRSVRRLKPELSFSCLYKTIVYLALIFYVIFGVFQAVAVYKNKSESSATKFAVKIYPYPVAMVSGRFLWAKDYYQQLSYIRQFNEKTKQPSGDDTALKNQIINQLIDNKILEYQALKYGVRVNSKDVKTAYDAIAAKTDGGEAALVKVINDLYGFDKNQFKKMIRAELLKDRIQKDVLMQAKVSHILIADEKRANEVAEKVKAGEDFAALAKQYSEDVKSRDNGGSLEWFNKGQLVADNKPVSEFETAVFEAQKGQLVGPIKTSVGFEIIKIEDKKGRVAKSYDEWFNEIKEKTLLWRLLKF